MTQSLSNEKSIKNGSLFGLESTDQDLKIEKKNVLWKTIEYHAFTYNERYLLFDIESLEVYRLEAEDKMLLESNNNNSNNISVPNTAESWFKNGMANGLSFHAVKKSFNKLKQLGIIIPEGHNNPKKANSPLEAFDYTFMVNVSQTCNLRCAYCYTNEGSFDFKEVKKTKISKEDACKIVHFVLARFPQAKTYCFHFYGGEPLINFEAIRSLVEETDKTETIATSNLLLQQTALF